MFSQLLPLDIVVTGQLLQVLPDLHKLIIFLSLTFLQLPDHFQLILQLLLKALLSLSDLVLLQLLVRVSILEFLQLDLHLLDLLLKLLLLVLEL